ncbi:hypothetical protein ACIQU4_27565 [Streptomyces sp. NPDC090741]|uniref:hypothetical protein n=1 Tax=Streptomyces sp. NPDC090741 TaxID=3365967 RepID=UPI0037FF0919
MKHADRASLTPIPHLWPDDAVPLNVNGYWYAAAYATAGGGHWARTVHFYTAEAFMGRTWCRFDMSTPGVHRLDKLARRRPTT